MSDQLIPHVDVHRDQRVLVASSELWRSTPHKIMAAIDRAKKHPRDLDGDWTIVAGDRPNTDGTRSYGATIGTVENGRVDYTGM
jgi:hypothetical protein